MTSKERPSSGPFYIGENLYIRVRELTTGSIVERSGRNFIVSVREDKVVISCQYKNSYGYDGASLKIELGRNSQEIVRLITYIKP